MEKDCEAEYAEAGDFSGEGDPVLDAEITETEMFGRNGYSKIEQDVRP